MSATSVQVDVSGRQIITSDGRCLDVNDISTGDVNGNDVIILLNPCDVGPNISDGQQWTIMTQGPHLIDAGFALVINTKTGKCVDMNLSHTAGLYAKMYECGGQVDGQGTQSVWQVFGYTKGSADSGKQLVFFILGALTNNGVGPGNSCWAANTTTLGRSKCDPINPTAAEKFTVGPAWSPMITGSSTSSTSSTSSPSSTPTAAIAGGVVGGIVLLGVIIASVFIYRRRQQRAKASSPTLSPKHSMENTEIDPFVSPSFTGVASSSPSSKLIPLHPGIIGAATGPRTATSVSTDSSSPVPMSVSSSNVGHLSVPWRVEDKAAVGIRRSLGLTTLASSSSVAPSLSASEFSSPSVSTSQPDREREEEARAFAAISGEQLKQRRIQRAGRPQDFGPIPVARVDLPPDYDQATEPLSR